MPQQLQQRRGRRLAVAVSVAVVACAVVLALLASGVGRADAAGVAAHRRAELHRREQHRGHRRGGGGKAKRAKAHGPAQTVQHNAFFESMQGAPPPAAPPRAKGYTPTEADPTLSFPALDYSAVNAEPLTPLSIPNPLPTARDFSSTTLPMPAPDPAAPAPESFPHVAPQRPRDAAALLPRFQAISERVDASAAHGIVSPDGGSVSPLREQPLQRRTPRVPQYTDDGAAGQPPHRQVIPIEVDPAALEAAETGSAADLMRFASVRGRELSSGKAVASAGVVTRNDEGEDISTPMALTVRNHAIAPNGPMHRAYRFRQRPRRIFAKRVTIPVGHLATAAAKQEYGGPFDTNNEEVRTPHEDDTLPRLTSRPAPHRRHRNPNLAAPPQTAFGADADPLAFLQTEQRVQQRQRRPAAYPSFVAAGSRVFERVNPRAAGGRRGRRHSNPHFHHMYRGEQQTREAAEAELMEQARDPLGGGRHDQFGHRLPRGRASVLLEDAASLGLHDRHSAASDSEQVSPSGLRLPAPGTPRPHAQFASPPLDLDRFDPFANAYGGSRKARGVPQAPRRPAPPPMMFGPGGSGRKPNRHGQLLASTFLATHSSAHAAPNKAAAKKPAAAKPAPKPAAKPAPKKAAPKQAPKPAAKKSAAKPAAKPAPKPAPKPAAKPATPPAPVAPASAPIGLSLLQRIEHEAGVQGVSGALSAATDLAALRRLEAAVRAAEERAELQARIDELQAQVDGLQQLRGAQPSQQQQ